MRHTKDTPAVAVSLNEAMSRLKARRKTQLDLELASGVDRTRISRLCRDADPDVLLTTYRRLDDALRKLGVLRAGERLVFGQTEAWAS